MQFKFGHRMVFEMLRPCRQIVGQRAYLFARWKRQRQPDPIGHKPRSEDQRGWMPGRWRLDGMQAPRRVIDPAVRFMAGTRTYNEIVTRRRRQGFYPPLPWEKKRPKRA